MKESFDGLIDTLVHGGFFLEEAVEILEKGMIERVLRAADNNQCEASKRLGIHRNTLLRKLKQYQLGGKSMTPRKPPVSVRRKAVRRKRPA